MFSEALKQLHPSITLTLFNDCKALLDELNSNPEFRPDIIYLDLNMPGNKDFECLREIRKSKYRAIPVIIYSTTDVEPVIRMAYDHGASRFIVKPLTFAGIKEGLLNIIDLYNNGHLKKE